MVGADKSIDVSLKEDFKQLSEVVVTGALGIKTSKRELGASQQTISGREVAQTQRENFINSLQGRIAGVDVTSTSGVPELLARLQLGALVLLAEVVSHYL